MADTSHGELRYRVFLSYSSDDKRLAKWLHQRLERYRVPRRLVGIATANGTVPACIAPVFRDRDDARTADDIETTITEYLCQSEQLVVLCTPAAAKPGSFVGREVEIFKRERPRGSVHAVVGYGDPESSFPIQLQSQQADGSLHWPLAADLRPEGDGRDRGFIKLVAGIIGVEFDALWDRESRRRRTQTAAIAVGVLFGVVLASGLATYVVETDRTGVATRLVDRGLGMLPGGREQLADSELHSEALGIKLILKGHLLEPTAHSTGALLKAARWQSGLLRVYETNVNWEPIGQSLNGRRAMALSAEGKTAVAAFRDGSITMFGWDPSGSTKRQMDAGSGSGRTTTVSLDGAAQCVVVGNADGKLRVVQVPGRSCRSGEYKIKGPVVATAVLLGGNEVAASGVERQVSVWISGRSFVYRLPPPATQAKAIKHPNHSSVVTAVALAKRGSSTYVIAGTGAGDLWIREVSDEQDHPSAMGWRSLADPTGQMVLLIAANKSGTMLATVRDNEGVQVWTIGTAPEYLVSLPSQGSSIGSIALSESGTIFMGDWKGKLFQASTNAEAAMVSSSTLQGHKTGVIGISGDAEGKTLMTWSADGSLRLIDVSRRASWSTGLGEIPMGQLVADGDLLHAQATDQRRTLLG